MRLKAVEMQGFKSFPDKTKITFETGVTCIIGPNGSGKSNILDAVRWVLGEMSMKSLRGAKMEDVIFNGTPARPAANCAVVSLYFDTEEEYREKHQLTLESEGEDASPDGPPRLSDFPETVITRKYYRSGESEYSINRNVSRLRDIYDMFYNTGIGREGYSVISQGKIAEVLSQKGDERRSIFEEAAGVSRFRVQKTAAERKLAETENNLLRLNDILAEVASRVKPLEKEAENAKRYKAYYDEKMGLEITLWLNSLDDLRAKRTAGEEGLKDAKTRLEAAEASREEAEKDLDALLDESYESSRRISAAEEEKSSAERSRAQAESDRAVCENDIAHFNSVIEDSAKQIDEASGQSLLTAQLISAAETSLREAQEAADAVDASCAEKESAWKAAREDVTGKTEAAERAESELSEVRESTSGLAAKEAGLIAEIEASRKTGKEAEERIAAGEERLASLDARKKDAEARRDEENKAVESLRGKAKSLRETAAAELAAEAETKEQTVGLRMKVTAAEQRRESLQRMEQLFEGYADSVRAVLKAGKDGEIRRRDGSKAILHGPVSNILSADGTYVVALEIALGAAAQHVVVETAEDAKAAIRYLKDRHAGRATFLPLETVRGTDADDRAWKDMPGYVGIASSLCQYDKKYEGIVRDLLGRTLIADEMDHAQAIASASGYRVKIVTLDGQVIHPGGSFTGGSAGKKVGVFTRAMDIERLSADIRTWNGELLELERNAAHRRKAAREAEEAALEADAAAEETRERLAALENEISGLNARAEEEQEHLRILRDGISAGEEGRKDLERRLESLRADAKNGTGRIQAAEQAYRDARAALEEARQAESEALSVLSEERILLVSKRAAAEGIASQMAQLGANLTSIMERANTLKIAMEAARQSIADRTEREKELDARISDFAKAASEAEEKLNALFGSREETEKKLAAARAAVREAQSVRDALFGQVTEEEANYRRVSELFDSLTAKLYDEYEMTYSDAEAHRLPPEQMDHAASRLASLKAKIRAMGVINVNAVEEYRAVKERFDFLSTQIEDLQKTRRSLDGTISRLEVNMRESFLDTFRQINLKFNEVFVELFGGGGARVELEDPDRPLECGIDIILRLPGKKGLSISLLSGGEQSFAAIALYLALQAVNPAPFCIFDEIESALDEINVNKFGAYIRAHGQKTQYIVITHRRGTMEHADMLYGVTMHQKGISDYMRLNLSGMEENFRTYVSEQS
ncbi:MAG: chromosome segregation protein SMC [Clostridia bacterium]|nr:chromosome segregation protein SMC [Clostridia bacterium]